MEIAAIDTVKGIRGLSAVDGIGLPGFSSGGRHAL